MTTGEERSVVEEIKVRAASHVPNSTPPLTTFAAGKSEPATSSANNVSSRSGDCLEAVKNTWGTP